MRLIRYYYGFQIFFSLLLWIPIFYEYQKRIGLTDTQIFSIQSIYYLVFCLLEIPTGVLADVWGYRFCLRLGGGILVVANLLPVLAPCLVTMFIHFILIALSRSLISGSSSAYLYDGLRAQGVEASEYKRIEGNSRSYGLIGKILIWPFIGALMQWKLSLPYLLTTVGAVIAVFCAWQLPPDQKPPCDILRASTKPQAALRLWGVISELIAMLRVLPRFPLILLLMLQGLAAFILPRIIQTNLFQPVLSSKGFAVASYGGMLAAASVFEALGSGYPAMKLTLRHLTEWNAVILLTAIMALSLATIPGSGQLGTTLSLMVFSLAAGMIFPVQKQLMNDAISNSAETSRYRATVLSIESIFDRAVCAWVVTWIGVYVTRGKIGEFLLLSASICGAGILLLSWICRRIGIGSIPRMVNE